jgi:glycosyltransferase involved in cell wall biosynthesis
MRIAIYENLPLGGAKRAAFEFARYLAASHELDLYRLDTSARGSLDLGQFSEHVYTYPFSPLFGIFRDRVSRGKLAPRSYTMFGPLIRLHRRMARDIDARGYDVLLAHTDGYTQAPHMLGAVRQVPAVYFCQEPFRIVQEKLNLEEYLNGLRALRFGPLRVREEMLALARMARHDRRNARAAKAIAANSIYSRERIWAAYARNAALCYLGIDANRFTPGQTSERRNEVVSVGVASRVKGHDLVIKALGLLPKDRRPALRIVMTWRGNAEPLVQLARAEGVELILDASLDDAAMLDRYRNAMATVCAARLEPFGLTPLESMACGTPVVAIREGGFRETVVDGKTGFLVDAGPTEIARAIETLQRDPALVTRLGQQARDHVVRSWGWDKGGRALDELLQTVAGRQVASSEPTVARAG